MAWMILGGRGKNWAVIVGSDTNNSDAGFTFLYQRKPPELCDGISDAWRHVWRVNIRWPVQIRHRRPRTFPGPRPAERAAIRDDGRRGLEIITTAERATR